MSKLFGLCTWMKLLAKHRTLCCMQEKAANALMLGSNMIRTVSGPQGNTVTFSKDMGLPSIFDSKPCRYFAWKYKVYILIP